MHRSNPLNLQIWCFLDGKPGHQNQTLGLIEAMRRRDNVNLRVDEIHVSSGRFRRFFGRWWRDLPSPDLLIGTGHATHLPMLVARRLFGGRSIVLLKPSLPLSSFDLCLIPDVHTLNPKHRHVWMTCGVLNRVQPSQHGDPNQGLILLGGPSQHFRWSDETVLRQLSAILDRTPSMGWTVATSRRTPHALIDRLHSLPLPAEIVIHDAVSCDWLPQQIQSSGTVWVSEDSVSMTYEAVTSGAAVGTIELPRPRTTRVTIGSDRLIEAGCITPWSTWIRTGRLQRAQQTLREADRAAKAILQRFYPGCTPGIVNPLGDRAATNPPPQTLSCARQTKTE